VNFAFPRLVFGAGPAEPDGAAGGGLRDGPGATSVPAPAGGNAGALAAGRRAVLAGAPVPWLPPLAVTLVQWFTSGGVRSALCGAAAARDGGGHLVGQRVGPAGRVPAQA
jgi:hypothetical protein